MKKIFIFMLFLLGMTLSAQAQIDINGVLNKVMETASGKKQPTAETLIGTWTYKRPAIILESDNALKKIGGNVASAAAENKFSQKLEKIGIKPGSLSFTFKEDKTFSMRTNKKTVSGTWSIENSKLKLKYGKVAPVTVATTISGKKMQMVFNSSLILKIASTVGSKFGNSTVSAISKIAQSYDGMKTGLELEK